MIFKKIIALVLIGTFTVPSISAAPAPAQELLRTSLDSWVQTPRYVDHLKAPTQEYQVFERYVSLGQENFPVGNIVFIKMKKPADMPAPRDVAESFRVSMGLESWIPRKLSNGTQVFESKWEKGNRFLKLFIKEEKESYSLTLATLLYVDGSVIGFEAELIQRHLAGDLKKPPTWLGRFSDTLIQLISPAEAGAAPPPMPMPMPGMPGPKPGKPGGGGGGGSGGGPKPDDPCSLGCNSYSWGTTTYSNCFQSCAYPEFKQIAAGFSDQADQALDLTREGLKRADKGLALAAKALDPAFVFKLAAIGAAGAVLGAAVASIAVEGGRKLIEKIIEKITGSEREEYIRKNFEKLRKEYEEQSKKAKIAEKLLGQLIKAAETAKAKNLDLPQLYVMYAETAEILPDELRENEAEYKRMRKDPGITKACSSEFFSKKVLPLREEIESHKQIVKFLKAIKDGSEPEFCSNIERSLKDLNSMLAGLQVLRVKLLEARSVVRMDQKAELLDMLKKLDELKRDGYFHASRNRKAKRMDRKISRKMKKQAENRREDAVKECVAKMVDRDMVAGKISFIGGKGSLGYRMEVNGRAGTTYYQKKCSLAVTFEDAIDFCIENRTLRNYKYKAQDPIEILVEQEAEVAKNQNSPEMRSDCFAEIEKLPDEKKYDMAIQSYQAQTSEAYLDKTEEADKASRAVWDAKIKDVEIDVNAQSAKVVALDDWFAGIAKEQTFSNEQLDLYIEAQRECIRSGKKGKDCASKTPLLLMKLVKDAKRTCPKIDETLWY